MGGAPLDWAKAGSRFKVQGSGFKVVVAASPRIYMGRCLKVVFKSLVPSP